LCWEAAPPIVLLDRARQLLVRPCQGRRLRVGRELLPQQLRHVAVLFRARQERPIRGVRFALVVGRHALHHWHPRVPTLAAHMQPYAVPWATASRLTRIGTSPCEKSGAMANHALTRTTHRYDRRRDEP